MATVRPYKARDKETIARMGDLAWREIYAGFRQKMGPELFAMVVPNAATAKGDQVRHTCESRPDCVWVCEDNGSIVGFVTFRMDRELEVAEITNNAVHPEARGRGYAQVMYQAVLEHFREEGFRYACVRTGLDEGHAPARKAYERAGFNIRQEMIAYYREL